MRDISEKEELRWSLARGRAQADTMQALTATPTLSCYKSSVDTAADLASGCSSSTNCSKCSGQALGAHKVRETNRCIRYCKRTSG